MPGLLTAAALGANGCNLASLHPVEVGARSSGGTGTPELAVGGSLVGLISCSCAVVLQRTRGQCAPKKREENSSNDKREKPCVQEVGRVHQLRLRFRLRSGFAACQAI